MRKLVGNLGIDAEIAKQEIVEYLSREDPKHWYEILRDVKGSHYEVMNWAMGILIEEGMVHTIQTKTPEGVRTWYTVDVLQKLAAI